MGFYIVNDYWIYQNLGYCQQECGRIDMHGNIPNIYFSRPLGDEEKNEVYTAVKKWASRKNYDNPKTTIKEFVWEPQYERRRTFQSYDDPHCRGFLHTGFQEDVLIKVADGFYKETLVDV